MQKRKCSFQPLLGMLWMLFWQSDLKAKYGTVTGYQDKHKYLFSYIVFK
jgi:hypothetical protein